MRTSIGATLLIAAFVGLLAVRHAWAQTDTLVDLKALMTAAQFKQAGLHKLEPAEVKALSGWVQSFAIELVAASQKETAPRVPVSAGSRGYPIEVSHNDELFVINGEKFEAQTYCFDMEVGDRVLFVEGSAFGACASAEFVNLRNNRKCEVWCE